MKKFLFILLIALSQPLCAEQQVEPVQEESLMGTPLTSAAAMALKGILEQHPDGAAHIVTALDNARKILVGMAKYKQIMELKKVDPAKQVIMYRAATAKFKEIILDPVRQFFFLVTGYNSLLRPMIEESFANSGTDFDRSIFYRFLDEPEDTTATFFDRTIVTKDDLIKSCDEFATLFGDFEATMPEAFEAGRVYLQELHDAAQAAMDAAAAEEVAKKKEGEK